MSISDKLNQSRGIATRPMSMVLSATTILLAVLINSITPASAVSSASTVPNVFSPNTPARASEVNQNFDDLDSRVNSLDDRVTTLESGSSSGSSEQTLVFVDCDNTPNFFLEAPFSTTAAPNTTYEISGICNGPVLIRDNGVELRGASNASTIVLPAGLTFATSPIEFLVAVFVSGANDVEISNLQLDATAFNIPDFDRENVGALFVSNSFVTLTDVVASGGAFTISAFASSNIRAQGTLSINNHFNQGLTSILNSNIVSEGTLDFFSTISPGTDPVTISAADNGHIEVRGDLFIAETNPSANIFAAESGYIRIFNGNATVLPGEVIITSNSRFRAENIGFAGNIFAEDNSNIDFDNVSIPSQSGAFIIDNSKVRVSNSLTSISASIFMDFNATLNVSDATLNSPVSARGGSFFSASNATLDGLILNNARGYIDNNSIVNGQFNILNGSNFESLLTTHNGTDIQGLVVTNNSSATIAGGNIENNIDVSNGGYLNLVGVTQQGSLPEVIITNSRADIDNSNTGLYSLSIGSSVGIDGGNIDGATLRSNSILQLDSVSSNGDINLFNSGFAATGDGTTGGGTFNGNTVFLCANQLSVVIDGLDLGINFGTAPPDFGLAASGVISTDCSDFSRPPAAPAGQPTN